MSTIHDVARRAGVSIVFGLFREMNTPGDTAGSRYKGTPYFNGGIFAEVQPFDLTIPELETLREAATTDWSAVRPENLRHPVRGLDGRRRAPCPRRPLHQPGGHRQGGLVHHRHAMA